MERIIVLLLTIVTIASVALFMAAPLRAAAEVCAYVSTEDGVSIINTDTNTVTRTIPLDFTPTDAAI